MLTLADSLAK